MYFQVKLSMKMSAMDKIITFTPCFKTGWERELNVKNGENEENRFFFLAKMSVYSAKTSLFLDASSHLYKRLCLSVRPSVRPLVRPSVSVR